MNDYIYEWTRAMANMLKAMIWTTVVLVSIAVLIALPILVVALFYFLVHLIFGVVFEWYIPIAIGFCFLMVIGMVFVD